MDVLVKRAAEILSRMYSGDKRVYSSFSPSKQLDDNGWTAALVAVRNQLGLLDPLHTKRA